MQFFYIVDSDYRFVCFLLVIDENNNESKSISFIHNRFAIGSQRVFECVILFFASDFESWRGLGIYDSIIGNSGKSFHPFLYAHSFIYK